MRKVFTEFSNDLTTYFLSMHCQSIVSLGDKTFKSETEHISSIACQVKSTESDLKHFMQDIVIKSDVQHSPGPWQDNFQILFSLRPCIFMPKGTAQGVWGRTGSTRQDTQLKTDTNTLIGSGIWYCRYPANIKCSISVFPVCVAALPQQLWQTSTWLQSEIGE